MKLNHRQPIFVVFGQIQEDIYQLAGFIPVTIAVKQKSQIEPKTDVVAVFPVTIEIRLIP